MTRLDWVATEERNTALPSVFGAAEVFHYSIPNFDETRDGALESVDDIGSGKLVLRGGELLIAKLNPRKSRVLLAESRGIPTVASTEFVALRPTDRLDSAFGRYYLQSERVRQDLNGAVKSVTRSQQRANPEDVMKMWLLLPGVVEQRAIADFLDAETAGIDLLIAKRQEMRVLLSARIASFHEQWFSDLARRYAAVPLRRFLATLEQGWSPVCEAAVAEPSEWGVLKTSAVSSGRFIATENKRLPDDQPPDPRWRVSD